MEQVYAPPRSRLWPAVGLALGMLLCLGRPATAADLIDRPAPLPQPVKLTIGEAKVAHLAPLLLMDDDLKAMNVELTQVEFVRYADARTALAAGSLDLATVGPADLPISLSQGITSMVALMGVGGSPKYVVVRDGVTLDRWQDLSGKKVAIAPASAVWFQFVSTLQSRASPITACRSSISRAPDRTSTKR